MQCPGQIVPHNCHCLVSAAAALPLRCRHTYSRPWSFDPPSPVLSPKIDLHPRSIMAMKSDVLARPEDTATSKDIVVHRDHVPTDKHKQAVWCCTNRALTGLLCFAPFFPWLTDIFFPLLSLVEKALKFDWQPWSETTSLSVMGGGRCGGGAGLMLVSSSWTETPDRHTVFVSGWKTICRTVAKFSPVVQPRLEGQLWEQCAVTCPLPPLQVQPGEKKQFDFFAWRLHSLSSLFFLVFNGHWQFFFLTLSLCLFCSFSALLSLFLCNKLWGMRRERGKIKESPHTLPSNIIRLSLMALLEYLPCVCMILSVCCFFLIRAWVMVCLYACVCLVCACVWVPVRALPFSGTGPDSAVGPPCHQPFHIEEDVQAPLQRSAWGSCPLFDVTSVLLWSSSTKALHQHSHTQ